MSTRIKVLYCLDDELNFGEDKNGNIYIFEFAFKDKKCENILNQIIMGRFVYLDDILLACIPRDKFNDMCKTILNSKE
jgi:hypothetical protein